MSREGNYSAEPDLKTNMIWNTPVCIVYKWSKSASASRDKELCYFSTCPQNQSQVCDPFAVVFGLIWTAFHLAAEVHTEKADGHWSSREQARRKQKSVSTPAHACRIFRIEAGQNCVRCKQTLLGYRNLEFFCLFLYLPTPNTYKTLGWPLGTYMRPRIPELQQAVPR